MEKKWLGDKTGQGFYKKTKNEKGKTEILTLDLKTMEYKPKQKVKFATLEANQAHRKPARALPGAALPEKTKPVNSTATLSTALFEYVSNRIPEIADELYKIDDAIRAGFGWEVGPFETWDAVGVKKTVAKMEEMGYKPNQWVYDMLEAGNETFYKAEDGRKLYYDIDSKSYKAVPGPKNLLYSTPCVRAIKYGAMPMPPSSTWAMAS